MKKIIVLFSVLFLSLISSTLYLSFTGQTRADLYRYKYLQDSDQLELLSSSFYSFLAASRDIKSEKAKIQNDVINLRSAYKKIEFISDYYYPKFSKSKINGPPLNHLNPYSSKPYIEFPEGLQRLDELANSGLNEEESTEIIKLSKSFEKNIKELNSFVKNRFFEDREIIEASRFEVLRILSMGITGFDTPGSLGGIEESAVVLQSLSDYLDILSKDCSKEEQKTINKLKSKLDNAIAFIEKNNDFDTFDRVVFIREYLNPIYGLYADVQKALSIETIYQTTSVEQPINYLSRSIFSDDFYNPYYYTGLQKHEDSKALNKLGEYLFFEPVFSKNAQRSCASCHKPEKAFADGKKSALSYDRNSNLKRNSPSLINTVYSDRFFYDLRSYRLEEQLEHVVFSHDEFNFDYLSAIKRVASSQEYDSLFTKAFPSHKSANIVSENTISLAISSYIISLSSFNSEVDKYLRMETTSLDESVKKGMNLFMGKANCGTCHFAPSFSGLVPPYFTENESEVLGVLEDPNSTEIRIDPDLGRFGSKILTEEVGIYKNSFKTTTVRNSELTAPYFHNGAFSSLQEVLDFYNNGGGVGHGLKIENQTLAPDSLGLNNEEIESIIAFLTALTDTSGLNKRPDRLPEILENNFKNRQVGGTY